MRKERGLGLNPTEYQHLSPPKKPRKKGHRGGTNTTETGVVEFQGEKTDGSC